MCFLGCYQLLDARTESGDRGVHFAELTFKDAQPLALVGNLSDQLLIRGATGAK
jgi:hypothetical protein